MFHMQMRGGHLGFQRVIFMMDALLCIIYMTFLVTLPQKSNITHTFSLFEANSRLSMH